MSPFTESTIEETALEWFEDLGYQVLFGPDIAFDGETPERETYQDVLLVGRLKDALARINPEVPAEALEDASRKVARPGLPSLVGNNRAFHKLLVEGVAIEYHKGEQIIGDKVHLVDFENPDNNDWLVVNQFTVEENKHNRRPDVVVFINGLR